MNETSMPFEAYIFVGITALLLSYVTIMETPSTQPEPESATSMLPSFMSSSTTEEAPPMLPAVLAPSLAPESSGSVFSNFQSSSDEPSTTFSGNQSEEQSSMFPSFTSEQPLEQEEQSQGQPQPQIMGGKKRRTKKYKKTNKKTKSKR